MEEKKEMKTHDPSEYIRGLQQLLVSDKKKIAFLFGAGTSLNSKNKSLNIPAIGEMTSQIEKELQKTKKYKVALDEIKREIHEKSDIYTIETLLTNLEQKQEIIGEGNLNGLDKRKISTLIKNIKRKIKDIVSVHKKIKREEPVNNFIHRDFAEWIGRADRKHAIEIFTTNYDYLFELGLESHRIPYYDGFTGAYQPFFNANSIEDLSFLRKQTKLWKIHGCLGWYFDKENKKIFRRNFDECKDDSNVYEDFLIYPTISKYNNSKKQPYLALMDRLTNFLKESDTILITCGYSFSDEHINERILTALSTNSSTHIYALFFDINKNEKEGTKSYTLEEYHDLSKLAKSNSKVSVYGCRSAIIGCQYGDWELKKEPSNDDTLNINLYYDEDAFDSEVDKKEKKMGTEIWTGKGDLILPNFENLVGFLRNMIYDTDES